MMPDGVVVAAVKKLTHAMEYNPNCVSPYLVRLIGKGMGVLDGLPAGETKDVLGYGLSYEGAVRDALHKAGLLEGVTAMYRIEWFRPFKNGSGIILSQEFEANPADDDMVARARYLEQVSGAIRHGTATADHPSDRLFSLVRVDQSEVITPIASQMTVR